MKPRILKSLTFAVLAAWSVLALAQAPARVGRIAMTQGQVSISGELGEETSQALVNWPVTSHNQITTGHNARTEVRIGSTAVRLDEDSALDVTELDDDNLRLHLHYGSASVRVRNPDLARGFEMSTPQGVIHMQEVGRLRVDAGRRPDSTMVSVFDGVAVVDGGGSRLIVRAGKRAELGFDDLRTGLATRDSFDEWGMLRDERDERSQSIRYVTAEMTGYEELDQNGSWVDDREYGPLWSPRRMPIGWAPYRDGQWTYVQPWGWTWVDNAPWGYAPFHYGRWVMVNQRWCWAPGRDVSRVVWSPALVGWVGGSNWNVAFNNNGTHRAAPAQGWYPLAPHDTYVPSYRMSHDNLRYINRAHGEPQPDIRGRGRHDGENQRLGLTVVPHAQFSQRGTVVVKNVAQAAVTNLMLQTAQPAVPPAPVMAGRERNNDGRGGRNERGGNPVSVPAPGVAAAPALPPIQAVPRREGRFANDDLRRDSRTGSDDPRGLHIERSSTMPTRIAPVDDAPRPARVITLPSMPVTQAAPVAPAAPVAAPLPQVRDDRFRAERNEMERERRLREPDQERERHQRGAEPFHQQVQQQVQQQQVQQQQIQQQQQAQQQQLQQRAFQQMQQHAAPAPAPAPMAQVQPQPQRMAPPPQAAAQPAPAREEHRKPRDDQEKQR